MELVNGRPTDIQGRLDKEIRVYDFLDSLGVSYQRIDHEAAMTMEACEEIDRTLKAYMEQYLDITPGSLSVLGLMNDKDRMVRLLIDEDVLTGEYIGCHPCINTSSLRLRTKDLAEKIIPAMGHEPTIVKL